MKRIRFIYGAMLLVLALAMNACDDYYSVAVAGDPGVTPVVLTTPEESITLPAKDAAGEVEIVTNMENSTISIAVPADAKSWCSAALSGNKIAVTLVDNPRTIARSTILTVKVFSITCKIEVVQEAKTPEPIYPIEGTYKFNIPSVSDFDATKIYKVMDGNLKVAEICLEYLKNDNIASRAVVVYTGEGGAADYTRGFVAYLVDDEGNVSEAIENGGTTSFDYAENTLDYVAGTSEAVHTVYLSSYGITKKEPEEAVKETVPEPYLVSDMEGNSYPVVKSVVKSGWVPIYGQLNIVTERRFRWFLWLLWISLVLVVRIPMEVRPLTLPYMDICTRVKSLRRKTCWQAALSTVCGVFLLEVERMLPV